MIQVYLVKRALKSKKRNGQREYRWALRWEDSGGWRCEGTGTADRTAAEGLQKVKWSQLNGLAPTPEPEPDPEPIKAGPKWNDCRDAFERAMQADNLRPSYISSAKEAFNVLRRAFPLVTSPADFTSLDANEYKRQRSESGISPWSIRSDLATLKAVFGKWLQRECGLLAVNPFADIRAPRCDEPEVRIVTAAERKALLDWLGVRWNNWRLPQVYLEVAQVTGWRANEIASIRVDDLLPDGFVRVLAASSKTRRHKHARLPAELYADLEACAAGGLAFGRFSDDLRRLLILWKRKPNHAARVRDFEPKRLVGWLQDELTRFHNERAKAATEANQPTPATFTLHDFRRTAITSMQMAGDTEKETSVLVGATPEVIRKHYEKLDQLAIARKSLERRMAGADAPESLRARCARDFFGALTVPRNRPKLLMLNTLAEWRNWQTHGT